MHKLLFTVLKIFYICKIGLIFIADQIPNDLIADYLQVIFLRGGIIVPRTEWASTLCAFQQLPAATVSSKHR